MIHDNDASLRIADAGENGPALVILAVFAVFEGSRTLAGKPVDDG